MSTLNRSDRVRVKDTDKTGTLICIIDGDWMVKFDDGKICGYDGDMLAFVETEPVTLDEAELTSILLAVLERYSGSENMYSTLKSAYAKLSSSLHDNRPDLIYRLTVEYRTDKIAEAAPTKCEECGNLEVLGICTHCKKTLCGTHAIHYAISFCDDSGTISKKDGYLCENCLGHELDNLA